MPGGRPNKMQNALLKRMQQNGMSRQGAVATAKKKGLIKQEGKHLALTDKGRSSARKATRHLQSSNKTGGRYKYDKKQEKWKRGKKTKR